MEGKLGKKQYYHFLSMPNTILFHDGVNMFQWIHYQKKLYKQGELSSYQIVRLESIGIKWIWEQRDRYLGLSSHKISDKMYIFGRCLDRKYVFAYNKIELIFTQYIGEVCSLSDDGVFLIWEGDHVIINL